MGNPEVMADGPLAYCERVYSRNFLREDGRGEGGLRQAVHISGRASMPSFHIID